jgi:biopolymer transport protein ExbD
MKFYERKATRPVIPIVSLIDILAILLIFFIVTTTFKKEKALLSIALPKSSELRADVQIADRLTLSATEAGELYLGDRPVALEDLAEALAQLKISQPEVKLELKADEKLSLGFLVGIWDALSQSGFKIQEVPARILLKED